MQLPQYRFSSYIFHQLFQLQKSLISTLQNLIPLSQKIFYSLIQTGLEKLKCSQRIWRRSGKSRNLTAEKRVVPQILDVLLQQNRGTSAHSNCIEQQAIFLLIAKQRRILPQLLQVDVGQQRRPDLAGLKIRLENNSVISLPSISGRLNRQQNRLVQPKPSALEKSIPSAQAQGKTLKFQIKAASDPIPRQLLKDHRKLLGIRLTARLPQAKTITEGHIYASSLALI